jgi:hypothetical protein
MARCALAARTEPEPGWTHRLTLSGAVTAQLKISMANSAVSPTAAAIMTEIGTAIGITTEIGIEITMATEIVMAIADMPHEGRIHKRAVISMHKGIPYEQFARP